MKIATPYIRKPIPPNKVSLDGIPKKYTNYTDYDLFLLLTNFTPYLEQFGSTVFHTLKDDRYHLDCHFGENGKACEKCENYWFRYYVEIYTYDGGDVKDFFNEKQRKELRQAVKDICERQIPKNLAFILSYHTSIPTKSGKIMDSAWVNAMLSYLPVINGLKPQFHKKGLYIMLLDEEQKNYERVYDRYYEKLIEWLQNMYEKSYLPCIVSNELVRDWNLTLQKGLLRPKSYSYSVMGEDRIEFYLNRVNPYPVPKRLNPQSGDSTRLWVWTTPNFSTTFSIQLFAYTLFLCKNDFTLDQNRFHVIVKGFEEAKYIMNSYKKKLNANENELVEIIQSSCSIDKSEGLVEHGVGGALDDVDTFIQKDDVDDVISFTFKEESPISPYHHLSVRSRNRRDKEKWSHMMSLD